MFNLVFEARNSSYIVNFLPWLTIKTQYFPHIVLLIIASGLPCIPLNKIYFEPYRHSVQLSIWMKDVINNDGI